MEKFKFNLNVFNLSIEILIFEAEGHGPSEVANTHRHGCSSVNNKCIVYMCFCVYCMSVCQFKLNHFQDI